MDNKLLTTKDYVRVVTQPLNLTFISAAEECVLFSLPGQLPFRMEVEIAYLFNYADKSFYDLLYL